MADAAHEAFYAVVRGVTIGIFVALAVMVAWWYAVPAAFTVVSAAARVMQLRRETLEGANVLPRHFSSGRTSRYRPQG